MNLVLTMEMLILAVHITPQGTIEVSLSYNNYLFMSFFVLCTCLNALFPDSFIS